MLQDFVIFVHRELILKEDMDEAREYADQHQIPVDWNHISRLLVNEQYIDCFLYTQGFVDFNKEDNVAQNASLFQIYSILRNFFFQETL